MNFMNDIKDDLKKIEAEESLAMMIVHEYKNMTGALEQANKRLTKVIFGLLAIIALFVGGLVYVVTNYDFSYEDTEANTTVGNACIGNGCINE